MKQEKKDKMDRWKICVKVNMMCFGDFSRSLSGVIIGLFEGADKIT